jgi:hypothetical protein
MKMFFIEDGLHSFCVYLALNGIDYIKADKTSEQQGQK